MAKRSDNLESTLLILELLRHIPKKRFISAKELYEELNQSGFKRDLRTIQRNLNTLSQHFDIECDMRTKPYGYRWKEKSVGLSLPMLTEAQSLVLMLAKQQLKNLLPSNVMASMKPFFEQAERKLIYDQKDNAENEWLDKVCAVPTSQPLLPAEINQSIFAEISEALFYNKYLAIEYINQTGKSIKGRIMPLALAQQGASLYLVTRFEGHDNERHLALHRFKSAEMSTMSFVRPKEFDLKKY